MLFRLRVTLIVTLLNVFWGSRLVLLAFYVWNVRSQLSPRVVTSLRSLKFVVDGPPGDPSPIFSSLGWWVEPPSLYRSDTAGCLAFRYTQCSFLHAKRVCYLAKPMSLSKSISSCTSFGFFSHIGQLAMFWCL